MSKKFYIDKGSELVDYYCPSGFRWLTNTDYIDENGRAIDSALVMIQDCWRVYGSVAVGSAFGSNGAIMYDMISIYVRKLNPKLKVGGEVCSNCGGHFAHEDVVHVEEHYKDEICLCKDCFHCYDYKEVV